MSVRDLMRSFAISPWEIEQAAELRRLRIVTRRPSGRGRPSRVAELRDEKMQSCPSRVGKSSLKSARDTGYLRCAQREMCPGGMRAFGFNIPGIVTTYIETYQPKSRAGARASASRLMRRPHVKAAMQWFYAQMAREIPGDEPMPETGSGIREGRPSLDAGGASALKSSREP